MGSPDLSDTQVVQTSFYVQKVSICVLFLELESSKSLPNFCDLCLQTLQPLSAALNRNNIHIIVAKTIFSRLPFLNLSSSCLCFFFYHKELAGFHWIFPNNAFQAHFHFSSCLVRSQYVSFCLQLITCKSFLPLSLHRFERIALQMTSPPAPVDVLSIGVPGAPTVEIVTINVYNMNF